MNINSRDTFESLFTAFNTSLNKGLLTAYQGYLKFAMTIASSGAAEKYPALLMSGVFREWVGDRVINRLSGKLMTVRNKDFELTQAVSLNDIEDDNLGFFTPLFEAMGVAGGNLWAQLASGALTSPGKWADGDDFFKSTRKIEKATINNIVSGALSVSTYETARSQMMAFKAADNKTPLGLIPTHLVVGASNEATAKRIAINDLVTDGSATESNPHKGEIEVEVNPYITDGKWFLVCANRGLKPIAVQKRKESALQRWDKESDACVADANEARYGLHYRGEAFAAVPQLVVAGNLE